MSWWRIVNQLLNNEQVIQKLADSAPIRRIARLIASTYYSNYDKMNDAAQQFLKGQTFQKRLDQFSAKFKDELKKELEDIKKKTRDK